MIAFTRIQRYFGNLSKYIQIHVCHLPCVSNLIYNIFPFHRKLLFLIRLLKKEEETESTDV